MSPWGWLVVGIALQLISNGRWIVALATWVAPVGWLVFLERSRARWCVPVAFSLFMLVEFVAWRGLVPAPGMFYYLIVGTYSVVYFLPFLLHRLLAPRVTGLTSTLIFPSAWVGVEFAFQQWVTPYGSWFSIAYTQSGFLALAQLAALSGTAGISFLLTWFAAVVAWVMHQGYAEGRRAALFHGFVLASCIGFGQMRLLGDPSGEPLRVAGVLPSPVLVGELEKALAPVRRGERVTGDQLAAITGIAGRLNDDLFARTAREARAGAQLVAWSETAGRVLKSDEAQLRERASQLAREESVDLLLAYGVWIPDGSPPFENKVVAVSRRGDVAWDFHKARPIVGPESPFVRAGDGVVRAMETPSGGVSALICHDLDFPNLVRQVNHLNVGLLLAPSADWRAITPLHANMAILRSIESGFSLFRPTSTGRSVAVDTRGRPLMVVDYAEDAVVADVPIVAVSTVYGAIGDWFAWACLGGLMLGAGLALRRHRGDEFLNDGSQVGTRSSERRERV